MSTKQDEAATVRAPSDELSVPRKQQVLSDSGTTESHNSTKLHVGAQATLLVSGDTAVRVAWRATTGESSVVSSSNIRLETGARFDWTVTRNDCVVYVEAEDGSSSYEVAVWTSSDGTGSAGQYA